MPNYTYECVNCGEYSIWQSMQSDRLTVHEDCGGTVTKVYGPVRTGNISSHTQEVDAREARWDKDMPAYKRFRDKGLMPPQIDGCDRLEATAENYLEVNSGGRIKVDEHQMQEAKVLADDIMAGRV